MIDIWTKLALAGAAVSFATYLALKHARQIACISDRIVRIPRSRLAAFLLFAAVATVCAQKGGNTNTPPEGASSPRAAPPVRTDEGGGDVTNLCFAGISVSSNAIALSLAWPTNFFEDGACLDFFAKVGSLTNSWAWIASAEVLPGETNLVAEIPSDILSPATNLPSAAFFLATDRATSAATMADFDCDGIPDVYELHNGTNTAIYAAVHGVDDRISNTVASVSRLYYSDYYVFLSQWAGDPTNTTLSLNQGCCMNDIDLSFMSVACEDAVHPYGRPLVAISPIHVMSATHIMIPTNKLVAFRTSTGDIINRRVVATNILYGIAYNDLCVGILDEPLPAAISIVQFLPPEYKEYIGTGKRLPWVRIGRDKSCSLHDILRLSPDESSESMTRLTTSLTAQRRSYARAGWSMDSGHPIFLLFGNAIAYLCPASGYYSDGLTTGYLCSKYLSRIQAAMDDLSRATGKDFHELQTFSFATYSRLMQH